ncbi:MAG: phosphoenolpyruvate hydrolase family protein [Planctomycetota bacterium]|jgi:predicted TIM-barrel enzyme|nr:phosphoenolpyruvate hydrolase family protein [Planctomycetota bacterium]
MRVAAEARPFWGVGVSIESSAKAADAGATWGLVSHAVGLARDIPASAIGLLPFADANAAALAQTPKTADPRILPVAAVFANDKFRTSASLLGELAGLGYEAAQNFPSVGLPEGRVRAFLNEAEMVYEREAEFIAEAAAAGFFAMGVFFTAGQAVMMAEAGADMLVFHPGLNADGEHREWNHSSRVRFMEAEEQARAVNPDLIIVRSSFNLDDWPPGAADSGIGVQYDGWM